MRFNFEATGLGSVPFKEADRACSIIFDNFKSIPFWPQLPKKSYLENMYIQFSERLPGLILDESSKSIHIDTSKVAEMIEEVYGKYLEGDVEFFKISDTHAAGFYAFLEKLKETPKDVKFVKGQITGPISFALSVTDQNKRSILYDKDLFEVLTKTLIMKARWQIRKLKKAFPGVIIFVDEPYLVSIGSSYVNIDVTMAFEKLDELVNSIKAEGALAGIHCCGNTDWGALLKRNIDILSFDAYNFTNELVLYSDELKDFLEKGGSVAWGMVPSSEIIMEETEKSLKQKLGAMSEALTAKGIKKDKLSSLITPSCGVGTLDDDAAYRVFELTARMSRHLGKI